MPIKKSTLEQKWYYRAIKVFFLILPLILLILLLLNRNMITCNVKPVNIFDILQNNIVYIIAGLIVYFLILTIIWKIFLYIAFGGVEDDAQKKDNEAAPVAGLEEPRVVKIVRAIAIIVILGAFAIFILSKAGYLTESKMNTNSSGLDMNSAPVSEYTCPATSAQTATPCHSVKDGIGVFGVIVPDKCKCPSDTIFAQMDNITAGGPYKICTCK